MNHEMMNSGMTKGGQNQGLGLPRLQQRAYAQMGPGQLMGSGRPGPWWSYGRQSQGPVESINQAIEVAKSYLASLEAQIWHWPKLWSLQTTSMWKSRSAAQI